MGRAEDAAELAAEYPGFDPEALFHRSRIFEEVEPGRFRVELPEHVTAALGTLVEDLRDLLLVGDRAALQRLYPPAYPDEELLQEQYEQLVTDQLLAARLEGLDRVEASLGKELLDSEELTAWMQALNQIRLVVGTRLDVSENDPREDDPSHPEAGAFDLYQYLGYLVSSAVDALAAGTPRGENEGPR